MRKFRVGIIGAGGIFRGAHAAGWKALPEAQIVAVCDVNKQRAAEAAKEAGAERVFSEDMSFQLFGMAGGVKWPSAEFATVAGGSFAQGTLTHSRRVERPHSEEIKAFYDCVVSRKPSPVPWTETIKVIGILEAIYESQKKGREVAVRA